MCSILSQYTISIHNKILFIENQPTTNFITLFFSEIEDIRLAGSNVTHRGRVEIQYEGEYGTICDTTFDDAAAKVVCRMLGFVDGSPVSAVGPFGKGMETTIGSQRIAH